jgi:hypothetical protein
LKEDTVAAVPAFAALAVAVIVAGVGLWFLGSWLFGLIFG